MPKTWRTTEAVKNEIIACAKRGLAPALIAAEFPTLDSFYINSVIQRARSKGEPIPYFRPTRVKAPIEITPARQTRIAPCAIEVALNHSELAALKKLLGLHRDRAERDADALGISLQAHCSHLLRKHFASSSFEREVKDNNQPQRRVS